MDNKLLGLILSGDKKLAKEVAVERARITALATLPEGSTTGDAELMDARVDVNGTVHDNVGEHIRAIETELEEGLGGGSYIPVTAEGITEALGYTPADVADVTQLKSDLEELKNSENYVDDEGYLVLGSTTIVDSDGYVHL